MNLRAMELFIFDLDGVVYLGEEPIKGAKETLAELKIQRKQVYYVTNNSTRTRAKFCEKLSSMGIEVSKSQIITSAYATVQYLQTHDPIASVYIIGEEGLIQEFQQGGFHPIPQEATEVSADYVIVGLDRAFTYKKLATALRAIIHGARFIATNMDPTLPTEEGILPGAGSLVDALKTAASCNPIIVIGKPNPYMVQLILKETQISPEKTVIVGDRYSTDIKAGFNANTKTLLVKTGTGHHELQNMPPEGPAPDLILESIADILKFL
ncbi:MAG: HAD-IIA family hydrolase [Candidatus Helarchaeota archaeon]